MLQLGKSVGPHSVDELPHIDETVGVREIEPPVSVTSNGHETCLIENPKMLRARRSTDRRDRGRETAAPPLAVANQLWERAPRPVAQRMSNWVEWVWCPRRRHVSIFLHRSERRKGR